MMYIAYKKINGYTISDNTDHQRFLYKRGVSAPTILVYLHNPTDPRDWRSHHWRLTIDGHVAYYWKNSAG